MLEGCQEILLVGFILDNMCLLQAQTFAAALILGLVMLITEDTDIQDRKSFDGAMAVLQKFSTQSQQSERYLEILSDLSNVVNKRQQQIATFKRERSSRLVTRIFRPDGRSENVLDSYTQYGPEVNTTPVNEGETLNVW
ncbi:hypothetical protein BKA61DRAFT_219092 [Leptodontidium sp. MPI-SDFR-AT-0119]|nr:hypothetical protein BKA61DRAFT_219092 [Leptodontidium sp. MPI-SDFR-AT-0119]